jgi:hypothetical protein
VLVLGAVNAGYSQRRDYVSTLAAHGADLAWLGVLAICAAAVAIIATALVLRSVSRGAAVLAALAGAGFVVVAFSRLDCPKGPAGCGLGGRFEVSGAAEITHSAATAVSEFLLVAAMAVSGIALVRAGHGRLGRSSIAAAILTAVAFLATGGSSPGWIERTGILVATAWMAAVALDAIRRREPD